MSDKWVTITIEERLNALLIQGLLESNGFWVRLQGEALGTIYGLKTGPLGMVKVQVLETDVEQAKKLLKEDKKD
ncbi:MAG: hypothetical protein PWP31_669 [Clostridia bacterium]|nr:hypothetical protein [Clostridia bacterium]